MVTEFPWEKLKAETLRTMCKDLELPLNSGRKREDMVNTLKRIEELGIDGFLKQHAELEEHEKALKARPAPIQAKPRRASIKTSGVVRTTRKSRSSFDGVMLRSAGSGRRSTKSSS